MGTLPDTLASKASYEYWLVAEPESLISYVPGTARVEVVRADGTSADVTASLSVSYSNGAITAGSADILAAIPGLAVDDTLVLHYTCEYNPNYNLGFGHGNPSWAHVEYTPSGSASQASLEPAAAIASQASADVRAAGYAPASGFAASQAVLRPAGSIAAQAAGSPSANIARTPDVKATVYCYALDLVKLAGDTGKPLAGASFRLHDDDGLWYAASGGWTPDASAAAVMTTGAGGELLFPGLDADQYTLVETAAPSSYMLLGPAGITATSGIPDEAEWLRVSSGDVTVTGVDSRKGTIGVSATDPRSGGGPDDPDPNDPDGPDGPDNPDGPPDGGSGGGGTPGPGGAGGPGGDASGGDFLAHTLSLMGDSAALALAALAVALAGCALAASRRKARR